MTIVIPSRGLRERAALLWRTIDSVRQQTGVRAIPLVVLNGAQRASEVEGALRAAPGVRLIVREDAYLPAAHRAGRAAVDTPFYGTLDDDDTLLPGALARRVRELEEHPDADVVVTNGLVRRDGKDTLHVPPDAGVAAAPLRALRDRNWLLPGSWLARTERVGLELLDGMPLHRECTYLAVRFANDYRMRWVQEPTVVYHLGSPAAVSQSRDFLLRQTDALQRMLELPLPAWFRRHLRWSIAASYHESADVLLKAGELEEAWRLHLRSLVAWYGVRYLPFTRHLLGATWRRVAARTNRGDPIDETDQVDQVDPVDQVDRAAS